MTHQASHNPKRVSHKPRDKGAAHAVVSHERRHKSSEGRAGFIGTGATITGATVQTSPNPALVYPGVVYDSSGLKAYNAGGVITMQINAADGSVTVNGTGVITGGTIQTSATNPRVVMDGTGIRGYNASGLNTFNLSGTDGSLVATGVITSSPGSSVPWQTAGFFIGGGNLLSNASAEDPTSTLQTLYFTTGANVTAGTFTLQYGSGTVTSALAWNSTAAQVQTALNAAGVLPSGIVATCSGGPLPGTAITISLAGFAIPNPSSIAVASQSLTGGSAQVGPIPIGWGAWVAGAAAVIFTNPGGSAYHGGNVIQITAMVSGSVGAFNTFGISPPPGTKYTLSSYFKSIGGYTRAPLLIIAFQDASGNSIASYTAVASFNTSSQWQRFVYTVTVPAAATRQQVSLSGGPTGGTFTLTFNGQTTAPIPFNSTAAQVLSAVQALSNVGSSGVGIGTGGPLPGTPVALSFSVANPTTMTANIAGLSGGTPGASVVNLPIAQVESVVGVYSPTAGEVFQVDAAQLEAGDAPTAFGPRPDEIVANTVKANMITVSQLSAISANLGTIVAGTITGTTIQTTAGGVIQTAASGDRAWMDSTGFNLSAGTTGSPPDVDRLVWRRQSDGLVIADQSTYLTSTAFTTYSCYAPDNTTNSTVQLRSVNSNGVVGSYIALGQAGGVGQVQMATGSSGTINISSAGSQILMDGTSFKAQGLLVGSGASGYGLIQIDSIGNVAIQAPIPSGKTTQSYINVNADGTLYMSSVTNTVIRAPGFVYIQDVGGHWTCFGGPLFPTANNTTQTTYQVYNQDTRIWNNGTGWGFVSDRTMKYGVKHLVESHGNPLKWLKQIRGVSSRWKANDELLIGFIAQEVEQAMPDAVLDTTILSSGVRAKGMDIVPMVAMLWEATKSILEKVEVLESSVKGLDHRVFLEELGSAKDATQTVMDRMRVLELDRFALELAAAAPAPGESFDQERYRQLESQALELWSRRPEDGR